ncbi:MAG: cache domain-containing protein [Treponema sp.]
MTQSASEFRGFRKRIGISLVGIMLLTIALCSIAIHKISAKAAEEYAYQQLVEKAADSARLIDSYIQNTYQMLNTIAALPLIADPAVPFAKKALFLADVEQSAAFQRVYIADMDGRCYSQNSRSGYTGSTNYGEERCIRAAQNNKCFITEPVSGENGLVCIVSVPVSYNGNATGILFAEIAAKALSGILDSVQIAHTGTVSVINETGTLIAFPNFTLVERQMNILEDASEDSSREDFTALVHQALTQTAGTGSYSFLGHKFITAFTTLHTTGWTIIVKAPEYECTFIFRKLALVITQISIVISIIVCILVFFMSCSLAEQYLHRQ